MSAALPDPKKIVSMYRYRPDLGLAFDWMTGRMHRFDSDIAADIFQWAGEGASVDEITDRLCHTYEVDRVTAAADADHLLRILEKPQGEGDREWYSVDKGFEESLSFPLRIEIELTSVCNWNCGFCYNVWKIDPNLSDADVRRKIHSLPNKHIPKKLVFDTLDECSEKGCMVVRYSGGEPTLHPDFMEIMRYGGARRMYQVLFTNGHFLTPQVAADLVDANVRTLLISIHGDPETHVRLAGHRHAYDRATQAMQIGLAAGAEVVAEATLVQDNLGGILDVMRDVYARGVREFRVMRYVPTGKHDEQYAVPPSVMLPLMKGIDHIISTECPGLRVGWPCGQKFCTSAEDTPLEADDPTLRLRFGQLTGHCESGLVWGSISFDGKLRNCPHSNVYWGDVRDGISGGWQRMTRAVADAVATRASCEGCSVAGVCRGGCHLPKFIRHVPATGRPVPVVQAVARSRGGSR